MAMADIINPRPAYPADIIINRNKLFDLELTPRYYITPSFSSFNEIKERGGSRAFPTMFSLNGWKIKKKGKKKRFARIYIAGHTSWGN